jgi:hypothetical protein
LVLDTVTTLAPGAASNPIVVRGERVDSVTVELTITNYKYLPSDILFAYADSVGVWYSTASFPSIPDRASPAKFLFGLAAMRQHT